VPLITLVRHGQAAAGWNEEADPGLSPLGERQALIAADAVAAVGDPVPIVSSPLKRAQETARPLARRWDRAVRIDPAFTEIPSPTTDLAERAEWLAAAMSGTWAEQGEVQARWRQGIVDALGALDGDAVVFTHFAAINVVLGHALGDDRLLVSDVDHCARTVIEVAHGRIRVVSFGSEGRTELR